MKRHFHRSLFGTLVCLIAAPQAMRAHDPHDPFVTVAVSPNYAQDHTVLAATDLLSIKIGAYALLKSSDGGVNWSVVAGLPNSSRMASIAFSPTYSQDQTVLVAGGGGLFLTANQGTTWKLLLKTALLSVTLSPNFAADNTLFVVTSQKTVLLSTDRGQTWTFLPLPAVSGVAPSVIAVSPNYATDKTLLMGTSANGIFQSTDGGNTWVQVTAGLTLSSVTALTYSPAFGADQTVFAATFGSGVLVSTTAGSAWMQSNSGITDLNATGMAYSPTYAQDATLWITCATAVFQSNTSGASWTALPNVSRAMSSLTTSHYQAVAAGAGGTGPVLYLAMYEGLWTSNSIGSAWQYIDTLPTRLVRHINLSPNYAQDQTIFVSTYGSGNLLSTNGGSAWTFQNTGMLRPYTDASGISSNFGTDGVAFSSDDQGLQRTTNRGMSWQLMHGLGVPSYPRALAVSPAFAQDSTVMIGLSPTSSPNTGVYLSQDGGNTWLNTSLTGVTDVISIAMSPAFATDRTAFAASPVTGVYKSTDGGMTWPRLKASPSNQLANVVVSPSFATDNTVFAAGITGGIFLSTDGGATWSTVPQTSPLRVLDLEVSPNYASDQSFFAGTIQKGLLKFTKGGASVAQITSFPDQLVTAVAISPNLANDHTLFAAGYHGIYKSTNGGTSWTNVAAPARIEESQNAKGPLEEPPTITYQGSWSEVTSPAAAMSSCYGYMMTGVAQDSLVLNFMGTGVALVTWIGPNQGNVSIQVDAGPPVTVSLNYSMDLFQRTAWQQQGLACGLHTVTLTGMQASGQTVSLDAFNVWVNGCPLH